MKSISSAVPAAFKRINSTSKLVTIIIVALAVASLSCNLISAHYEVKSRIAFDKVRVPTSAAKLLADGQAAKTSAARAYTATGVASYWSEYRTELEITRSVDRALEQLKTVSSSHEERELIGQIARNSDTLSQIEAQAYNLRLDGDEQQSIRILYDLEYREALRKTSELLRKGLATIETRLVREAQQFAESSLLASRVSRGIQLLNAIVILAAMGFYYWRVLGPIVDLTRKAKYLITNNRDIRFGYENNPSEIGELARALESYRQTRERAEQIALEQNRIENALAENQQLLQALIDHSPAAIYAKGLDGRYIMVNRVWCEFVGVPVEQAIGRTDFEIVSQECASVFTANDRAVFCDGQPLQSEEYLKQADGLVRSYLSLKFPIRSEIGEIFSIGGVSTDITDRKTAEAVLLQAKSIAEETARAKSDFLAKLSHEIRTPMNAVIGLTHAMLKDDLAPRQRDYATKIHRSGQHLLHVVNDILDLSKLDAGKLTIENQIFDLERLMEDVVSQVAFRAHAKGLELVVNVAPEIPTALVGDPFRLRQILINFADNAIKFTSCGAITLDVCLQEGAEEGVKLKFAVRDTGIGLTLEQIANLFKGFHQAGGWIEREYGGTGLGLAISKEFAELMGGKVGVQSEPGKGSLFWLKVQFPVGDTRKMTRRAPLGLRGRRVLVVDDSAPSRHVIVDQLTYMTFDVRATDSGEDAIVEIIEAERTERPYDVILLDLHMPKVSGIEVADRVRALSLTAPPHVIMMGHTGDQGSFDLRSNYVADMVVKPVSSTRLLESLINVLDGHRIPTYTSQPDEATQIASQSTIRGARVLLVEDNEINRQVVLELLSSAGLSVDVARDGRIAMALIEQCEYDIVFMDVQMPNMNGIEATQALRLMPHLADLPIVALTASVMPADRLRYVASGMNDFLAKPIEPAEFWRVLSRWVKSSDRASVMLASEPPVHKLHTSDPVIEGLDAAVGLRLVGGDRQRYLNLLQAFVVDQGDVVMRIRSALDGGDIQEAVQIIHTLKGLVGTIGAKCLRGRVECLEAAITRACPADTYEALLCALQDGLVRQIDLITEFNCKL